MGIYNNITLSMNATFGVAENESHDPGPPFILSLQPENECHDPGATCVIWVMAFVRPDPGLPCVTWVMAFVPNLCPVTNLPLSEVTRQFQHLIISVLAPPKSGVAFFCYDI